MKKTAPLTYKKAGVDINAGDHFVDLIAPLARRTFRREVAADIGSFGAFFKINTKKYREPVLVSGTDGVGTKLKIAFMADKHDTVGIDLVAMCVNDILTGGAEPLFFLDYFATGRLRPEKAAAVIKGIADGCLQAGCSLVGGETAEMPGFYADGEYDLSGFAVGIVDRRSIINGRSIMPGDAVIGLASNGLHSNGYSLVRKVLFERGRMKVGRYVSALGRKLGEELLRPTTIYVNAFKALSGRVNLKGMAHITGGGLPGNLPRIFPKRVGAAIVRGSWPDQSIFGLIQEIGQVPEEDMQRTFNMGIGYIVVVPDGERDKTVRILKKNGYPAGVIGRIEKGISGVTYVGE